MDVGRVNLILFIYDEIIVGSDGLDGPGIESRWGRDFPHASTPHWGPPSLLYSGYWVSFPDVKRPGLGVDHPPSSIAEVKERVELYLLLLCAFVAGYRVNFTLLYFALQ